MIVKHTRAATPHSLEVYRFGFMIEDDVDDRAANHMKDWLVGSNSDAHRLLVAIDDGVGFRQAEVAYQRLADQLLQVDGGCGHRGGKLTQASSGVARRVAEA